MALFEFQKQSLLGLWNSQIDKLLHKGTKYVNHACLRDNTAGSGQTTVQALPLPQRLVGVYPSSTARLCWGHTVNTKHSGKHQQMARTQWLWLPCPVLKAWGGGGKVTPPLPICESPSQSCCSLVIQPSRPLSTPTHAHVLGPVLGPGLYPRSFLTCGWATTTPKQHLSLHDSHLSSLYVVLKPTPGNECESTLKIRRTASQGETAPRTLPGHSGYNLRMLVQTVRVWWGFQLCLDSRPRRSF